MFGLEAEAQTQEEGRTGYQHPAAVYCKLRRGPTSTVPKSDIIGRSVDNRWARPVSRSDLSQTAGPCSTARQHRPPHLISSFLHPTLHFSVPTLSRSSGTINEKGTKRSYISFPVPVPPLTGPMGWPGSEYAASQRRSHCRAHVFGCARLAPRGESSGG